MNKFRISFVFFLIAQISCYAQRLYKEVSLGMPIMLCNEPAIAINPNQKNKVLIASNVKHIFSSKNGGVRFKHKKVHSSLGIYGDPVLMYWGDDCYYIHLAKSSNSKWPDWFDQIVIQKSKNHGKNWNDGIGIGKNGKMHDKPWIAIDPNARSPYYQSIYITWTQFDKYESKDSKDSSRILFSKSTDLANTFSEPIVISDLSGDCLDNDFTVEGATSCTGPQGEIYCAWAGHEHLYFDKSLDGGNTWGKDKIIMDIPKGWDLDVPDFLRTNGLPFLSSDAKGSLYICTAFEENGYNKVYVSTSEDGGHTWSVAKALQSDDKTHYMMPHAYLDYTTGNYFVLYHEVKNNKVNILLSYKLASSKSFKTIQVNEKTFNAPGKGVFFGDYINVCAVGNAVSMVWTEPKGFSTILKTRRLQL
ncbi:MAG: sialidase family protein [Chitinophagaceae bacterium]